MRPLPFTIVTFLACLIAACVRSGPSHPEPDPGLTGWQIVTRPTTLNGIGFIHQVDQSGTRPTDSIPARPTLGRMEVGRVVQHFFDRAGTDSLQLGPLRINNNRSDSMAIRFGGGSFEHRALLGIERIRVIDEAEQRIRPCRRPDATYVVVTEAIVATSIDLDVSWYETSGRRIRIAGSLIDDALAIDTDGGAIASLHRSSADSGVVQLQAEFAAPMIILQKVDTLFCASRFGCAPDRLTKTVFGGGLGVTVPTDEYDRVGARIGLELSSPASWYLEAYGNYTAPAIDDGFDGSLFDPTVAGPGADVTIGYSFLGNQRLRFGLYGMAGFGFAKWRESGEEFNAYMSGMELGPEIRIAVGGSQLLRFYAGGGLRNLSGEAGGGAYRRIRIDVLQTEETTFKLFRVGTSLSLVWGLVRFGPSVDWYTLPGIEADGDSESGFGLGLTLGLAKTLR